MIYRLKCLLAILAITIMSSISPRTATTETNVIKIGIVIMHGKGGSPAKHVAELASALRKKGILVANLEMPWSGRRSYDGNVSTAQRLVELALNSLRDKGAQKLFVAGHSQGGLFALYLGGKIVVDGIIAIAPDGNVANSTYREIPGSYVELVHELIDGGKGEEKAYFCDYEGSRGTFSVYTAPAAYLSWFDPDGAMNETKAVINMNPDIPVLFIGPTNDYPGLLKVKQSMFDSLPRNQLSKLYEPNSSHLGAPSASVEEIIQWTEAVAGTR